QLFSNNYAIVDFPFIDGLQYRINTGLRFYFTDRERYYGRNTQTGLINRGDANTQNSKINNIVLENIVNYNRTIGDHGFSLTGVYSFENYTSQSTTINSNGFPHDFLKWYSIGQAELI